MENDHDRRPADWNRLAYGINLRMGINRYMQMMRDPKRFDIIIFRISDDDESELYIRIIGSPEDVGDPKTGRLYWRQQKPLDDSFTAENRRQLLVHTVPRIPILSWGDNQELFLWFQVLGQHLCQVRRFWEKQCSDVTTVSKLIK